MNDTPLVSILVRTKNRVNLLRRAVESILCQTYRPLEVVIVNDGGEEVPTDLLNHIEKSGVLLQYHSFSSSQGRSAAANMALNLSSGKWLLFLDDDDTIFPEHIEKLANTLHANSAFHVAYSGISLKNKNGQTIKIMDDTWEPDRLRVVNYIPIHAVLFERAIAVGCHFDTSLELMEDWDFWLQLSCKSDFMHLPGVSGIYEIDFGSSGLSQNREINKVKASHTAILNKWKNYFTPEDYTNSILWLDTAIDYYRREAHSRDEEIKTLSPFRKQALVLENERNIHCEQIAVLENERNIHCEQIAVLKNERNAYREQINVLQNESNLRSERIDALENEVRGYASSNSWRFMKPLRNVGFCVRNTVSWLNKLYKLMKLAALNPHILRRVLYEIRFNGLKRTLYKIRDKSSKLKTSIDAMEESIRLEHVLELFHNSPKIPYFSVEKPIDIIIPIYNGKEFLIPLFQSLIKNTSMPYRLLVADDKSSDSEVLPLLYEIQNNHPHVDMILIQNKTNLGFIKTVNILSAMTENHFVLLNTDTEVPPLWIERLMYPIFMIDGVASSTPFTNAGTICSFPNYLDDNPIFEDMSVTAIDQQFQYVNFEKTNIEIPTGVGFCMGINKDVVDRIGMFDEIYGKGYSEENDWCQRAIAQGYKNLHVTNLFIYHKHGGSFSAEEKRTLQEKNMNILLSRYPNYTDAIHRTITADTLKPLRNMLKSFLLREKNEEILRVNHPQMVNSITIYYIGYLSSPIGVGRASNGYIKALKKLKFNVVTFDLDKTGWMSELISRITDDMPSFIIYHFNANELLTLDKSFLRALHTLSYVIAIWAWESDSPSEDFNPASEYVDEVWAISTYMLEALKHISCHINVLPHIIECDIEKNSICKNETLKGIRNRHSFVVGYMFDLNSYEFRKNPIGVIEAFKKAFDSFDDVALVLKISGRKNNQHDFDKIIKYINSDSRIYIIEDFWSDGEVSYFYHILDVYLALFRAEGFGLTIAEAMSFKTPVICTNYSGVLDYISDSVICIDYKLISIPNNWGPYRKGWQWADPDIHQASDALLRLYHDKNLIATYQENGYRQIKNTLSEEIIGDKIFKMLIQKRKKNAPI